MIDINLLRADKGGNPDLVRESQRKRGGDAKVLIVDQVLTLDDEWKKGVLSIPDDMISYCRMRRFIQEVSCWTSTDDAQMLQVGLCRADWSLILCNSSLSTGHYSLH